MVERHQDYLLNIPSVPPGGIVEVPLSLDSDAPFHLRLVRSRNIGLNGWRFQDSKRMYQSSGLRTDWIVPATPGAGAYPSRGSIVRPEMVFPPSSQIVVDVGNTTGRTITNAQLLFRGSKFYRDGAVTVPSYPNSFAVFPGVLAVVVANLPPNGPVNLFGQSTAQSLNNQLLIPNDSDFVFQYGVADPFSVQVDGGLVRNLGSSITNVYVQLKDESGKFYSNVPIHINDLFGQGLPTPSGSGSQDDSVLFFPGLMTPEIYIPRRHALYFDVYRFDQNSQGTVDLHFRFCGTKVFVQ